MYFSAISYVKVSNTVFIRKQNGFAPQRERAYMSAASDIGVHFPLRPQFVSVPITSRYGASHHQCPGVLFAIMRRPSGRTLRHAPRTYSYPTIPLNTPGFRLYVDQVSGVSIPAKFARLKSSGAVTYISEESIYSPSSPSGNVPR